MAQEVGNVDELNNEINASELVYNFGAGPAMLPREVMQIARQEFLNWQGCGMSVMEISHRSDKFILLVDQMEADFRQLLAIPDNYQLLFLHGGASAQFAMVPLNLLGAKKSADYFHTGAWSGKAIDEAKRFGEVNIVSNLSGQTLCIPEPENWVLDRHAAYAYYTDNETINGVQFHGIPDVGNVPLVTDMTSSLLSKRFDVSRYGLIFASAQKNIGLSGFTMVIIRQDLIGHARKNIPSMCDYAEQLRYRCMMNTPSIYSWYIASLVLQWLKRQGGVAAMEELSRIRSDKLYAYIDTSDFYHNAVDPRYRSMMNVPFTLSDETLNEKFLNAAKARRLVALKGHRLVGGMRASIYNAMPVKGVDLLVEFMQDFEREYN